MFYALFYNLIIHSQIKANVFYLQGYFQSFAPDLIFLNCLTVFFLIMSFENATLFSEQKTLLLTHCLFCLTSAQAYIV